MFDNELAFCKKILKNGASIRFHEYGVGSSYGAKKGTKVCRNIVVDSNYNFRFVSGPYNDGNVLPDAYSLMYRSNPSDHSKKRHYFFGDICLPITSDKKSYALKWTDEIIDSNLTTALPAGQIAPAYMAKFQAAIKSQIKGLIAFIHQEMDLAFSDLEKENVKNLGGLFLHFDLSAPLGVTHWYEVDGCLDLLDSYELDLVKGDSCEPAPGTNRFALTKTFLHMLTSGDDKGDNQFVKFDLKNRYKSLSVGEEDLRVVLFYYSKILDATNIPMKWSGTRMGEFMFRLIPSGEFDERDAESYLKHLEDVRVQVEKENNLKADAVDIAEQQVIPSTTGLFDDPCDVLSETLSSAASKMSSFDLILVKKSGNVLINVSEINNILKSSLTKNLFDIKAKALAIQAKYKGRIPTVAGSFYMVHHQMSKGEKYQAKFVKTMMKIYAGVFYSDPELSRIFIERSLAHIRENGIDGYWWISLAHKFLESLQKGIPMENEKEKSRLLGRLCARVAWPLGVAVGSFEKSEIGYISSRVTTLEQASKKVSEYYRRSLLHDNENKGGILLHADGAAHHQAVELIKEFETEGHVFNRDAFTQDFLDEYSMR